MMRYFAATGALLALMQGGLFADDPIFDVKALSSTPLNPRVISTVEKKGIVTETVRFHSETDGRKDVDIFAFFSYPKAARNLPAFIWNQGGLSQASPGATSKPAARGYVVMCIDFPQPSYRSTGDYPINTGLHVGPDPHKAPIYHGVVALLKAVSYLETRPEVDRNCIGIAGASWGGFFSTLMVGIDPRLKVGSCLYGCGSLQLGNAWWDGVSRNSAVPVGPAERERWRTTLDPAWRLPTKTTPIGWVTGTNDAFYSMHRVLVEPVRIEVAQREAARARRRANDLECLAENVYFEARGEPLNGQYAVAEVTLNRIRADNFPHTVCGVVHETRWNPSRGRLVADFSWTEQGGLSPEDGPAWKQAMAVAVAVYDDMHEPLVPDALFYHATNVHPEWSRFRKAVATIGNHIFYR